ncbi:hypothetical protein DRH14_00015 [Candidatus Shapirobacteria bacterium]|nr:MAG: hypothetical protein DRH14_00015 [Candidatus Shapirobacteria bacterium]
MAGKKKKSLTMADLLAKDKKVEVGFKSGQKVEGMVSSIKSKMIFIDIGGKSDAVVMGKEFEFVKDYVSDLKVGDKMEVQVRVPENDKGQILVSLRDSATGYGWNYFEEKVKSDGEVVVFAKDLNRGGAVVIAPFGFFGFIPGSQIGKKYDGDPEKMLGKKVKVKVLEVDRTKNRLVFSERLVSEPDKVNEETSAVDKLKIGDVFEAKVMRVEGFGLFVKIFMDKKNKNLTLEGLVHISEISWEKVNKISDSYKIGDEIKVKLISKNDGRLQFSIKRLGTDPWEKIGEKYSKDKDAEGEVVRLANFGALVRLEAGVEGLIHVSKLNTGVDLKVGDKVQVYIESIDLDRRKISLGLVLTKKPLMYK